GIGCWHCWCGVGGARGRGRAGAVWARGVDLGVPTGLGGSGGGRVRPDPAAAAVAAGAAGGVLRTGLGAVLARALPGGPAAFGRGAAWGGPVGLLADAGEVVAVSRPGAAGRRAVAGAVCRHGPAAGHAVDAGGVP